MKKITGKESIMDVVNAHPETAEIFINHGMHCLGCAAASFENIEEGCIAHGIDAQGLIDDLNKIISKKIKK